MWRPGLAGVFLAAGVLGAALAVASPAPEGVKEAPAPQRHDIARLGWMAGTWGGTQDGIRSEEHWMVPEGGLMLAMHRDLSQGKAVFFEFLRIEETPEGVAFLAQPRGRSAVRFPCIELSGSRVVFENLQHDYPQRIQYWMAGDGTLGARVEGMRDGKLQSEEWRWSRLP
jgi:hypothetical protein